MLESVTNIHTVNGLVFKDDLLLMDSEKKVPTLDQSLGEYFDIVYVRGTPWYVDNIRLYERSVQKAKEVNGIFEETLLETYTEDGKLTNKTYTYDEVHEKGLWHKGTHVWLVNDRGEILLHRRGKKVQMYPGLWENTAGGHVDAGDTSIETAQRELKEEIGIDIPKESFECIATIPDQFITNNGASINNEFDDLYLVSVGNREIVVSYNEIEVAETTWIHFTDLEKKIKLKDPNYVPRAAEYDILFPLLHARFDK